MNEKYFWLIKIALDILYGKKYKEKRMWGTLYPIWIPEHRKKKKKKKKDGDCRSDCGAVRVGNYSTAPIPILPPDNPAIAGWSGESSVVAVMVTYLSMITREE